MAQWKFWVSPLAQDQVRPVTIPQMTLGEQKQASEVEACTRGLPGVLVLTRVSNNLGFLELWGAQGIAPPNQGVAWQDI